MAGGLRAVLARAYGAAWEARRAAWARGWRRPQRVAARVLSVGNLSIGGAGKTTFALHLAECMRDRALAGAIVCRRYRPGPAGLGDEELLLRERAGVPVFAGTNKLAQARQAAAAGARWIVVDDGFSHWPLARDREVVLLDGSDLWGGGALLPAGRLREPRRALQRAGALVVTRCDEPGQVSALMAEAGRYAPGALMGAARHALRGVRTLDGGALEASGRAHVVTATGNPEAVRRTAVAAGFVDVTLAAFRDHHWFTSEQAQHELRRASERGATLLLTPKDAVRWPLPGAGIGVIEVAWEWLAGGDAIESWLFEQEATSSQEGPS